MSNIVKIGQFSDGAGRIRVVAPGYDADPAPSDTNAIIFDSDWPEVLATGSGFYGSGTLPTSAATVSASFGATLAYVPSVFIATPFSSNFSSANMSSTMWSLMSGSYIVNLQSSMDIALGVQPLATVTTSGFSFSWPALYGGGTYLWFAFLNDPTIVGASSSSRAGSGRWMSLTASGPVVAKPGANVLSTNYDDYLIPPVGSGRVLAQPVIAGSLSALPWQRNVSGHGEYYLTVAHNLGFVPFVFGTTFNNFLNPPSYPGTAILGADTTNFYVHVGGTGPAIPSGSTGSTLILKPCSYFAIPRRWL